MFTANSICCLAEALGIALPGNGTVPAVYSERIRLAKRAGMKVMELVEKNLCARDVLSPAAIHNGMVLDMAFGGSTNTMLHLTAIAQQAGNNVVAEVILRFRIRLILYEIPLEHVPVENIDTHRCQV